MFILLANLALIRAKVPSIFTPLPSFHRHIDGDHKLIEPYRIVIHGGIDSFSRSVVYLHASTNNRASTVLALFRQAISYYNFPSRV